MGLRCPTSSYSSMPIPLLLSHGYSSLNRNNTQEFKSAFAPTAMTSDGKVSRHPKSPTRPA